MPGLIHHHSYNASKARICKRHPAAEEAFEAAEWALLHTPTTTLFEQIFQLASGAAQVFRVPGTDTTPAIVIVFVVETFEGDQKWLLLDAAVEDDIAEHPRKVQKTKSTTGKR